MSIADKIQRLATARTNIRTAITNKGGTTAQDSGFEDFATDIASIPSGGGTDFLSYVSYFQFQFTDFPLEEYTLNNNNIGSLRQSFQNTTTLKRLVINNCNNLTTIASAFIGNSVLEEVTFNIDMSRLTSVTYAFYQASGIKRILGNPFDFTNLPDIGVIMQGCSNLEEVRFVPNTLRVASYGNQFTYSPSFSNATLVSLANCFIVGAGSVTLHNTPKSKLSTIMGTVTDGIFAESASGTVTLQDFITNTKGWTIA